MKFRLPALESDPRIAYALLFGSRARATASATSDVDLAIGLTPGTALSAMDIGTLISAAEVDLDGVAVDLVLLDEAPPALAYRIFTEGQLLFERDHGAFVARKVRAILDYLDFRPLETRCAEGVLAAASRG
jgi:predicted nucleotidyltransferase